jgi:hypothetical protein
LLYSHKTPVVLSVSGVDIPCYPLILVVCNVPWTLKWFTLPTSHFQASFSEILRWTGIVCAIGSKSLALQTLICKYGSCPCLIQRAGKKNSRIHSCHQYMPVQKRNQSLGNRRKKLESLPWKSGARIIRLPIFAKKPLR